MTIVTEGMHPSEFVLSEANGARSRDAVTVDASQTIAPADVLGQKTVGALSAAAVAFAGNTGTGTFGALTVDAGVQVGDYKLVCIEPGTNAGKFEVVRPDGTVEGVLTVAVAYDGSFNGTLSDATDFVSGDGFTVTVTAVAGNGRYVKFNPSATDGSQHAKAIAYGAAVTAGGETAELTVIGRSAEVKSALLGWNGATDNQKAAALVELLALGIVARS